MLGKKSDNMKDANWNLLHRYVLGLLSRSIAHNVIKEKTITDLMADLSSIYENPLANKKVHLMKKLFNLNLAIGMSDTLNITVILSKINRYRSELSLMMKFGFLFYQHLCRIVWRPWERLWVILSIRWS